MTTSKQEFVKTFLPDTVEDISFAQIDMDITDLSLPDVLRNINRTFPKNSRNRNAIASGSLAIGVLCKTELLYPLSGLLLIVTGNDTNIEIVSKNYVVIAVQEDHINTEEDIKTVIDNITKYLVVSFKDGIQKLHEFYAKFIYDEFEMELEEDDSIEDDIYQRYLNI